MKIYTEINYKWLDGQLVKTDSKSFDYEGELTLCVGGTLGQGLGAVGLGALTTNANEGGGIDTKVAHHLDQASAIRDDNTATFDDAAGSVDDFIGDTLETGQSNIEDTIAANTESFEDLESGINTGVDDIHDYGKATNTVVADELTRWSDAAAKFGKEVGAFLGVEHEEGDTTAEDELDKLKGGGSKALKNKNVANLKVNKSLGRARSSLRIG